jgi:hypothetical protein
MTRAFLFVLASAALLATSFSRPVLACAGDHTFDCSELVQWAHKSASKSKHVLPHPIRDYALTLDLQPVKSLGVQLILNSFQDGITANNPASPHMTNLRSPGGSAAPGVLRTR